MNRITYKLIIAFSLYFLNANSQNLYNDWQSIKDREYPKWFLDAKLGIFIHWGVYSVPAWTKREGYSEWFLRGIQLNREHTINFQNRVFGKGFKYKDYAKFFKAELFDPDEWANLFKKAGAKYIVFVSKHHDGYCLWDSKYSQGWNSFDTGPKRDLVGDLKKSIDKTDIKFGLYYSLTEWNNKLHRWYTDKDENIGDYIDNYMVPQFKELVRRYKPYLIFTDGEWRNSAEQLKSKQLISWYYNLLGKDAIVNNRWGSGIDIGFLTPEYSSGLKGVKRPWAEVRSLSRSFAWNRNEPLEDYISVKELVHFFVCAVSNGGGIIINVGPRSDGKIPLIQQDRLLGLGKWLKINGQAIYKSSKWENRTGEFKVERVKRIDSSINFDWVRNKPMYPISEDDFSIKWKSYITAPYSGYFDFILETEQDDESKLWVNKKLLFEIKSNNIKLKNKIYLEKGNRYKIKIEYKENKVNAKLKLYWKYKDLDKHIIPSKYFHYEDDKKGLMGIYESNFQNIAYTTKGKDLYIIIFKLPSNKKIQINDIKIKNISNIKLSLLGYDGNIRYKYRDDSLVIYLDDVDITKILDSPAWSFKVSNAFE